MADGPPKNQRIDKRSIPVVFPRFQKIELPSNDKTFLEDFWDDTRVWNDKNVWGS